MLASFGRSSLLWLVGALALVGCGEDERSPERTIHRFLKAAALGEGAAVYALLAPEDQQQLRVRAQLATAQAGGRQRFAPADLLATTLTSPAHEVGRVELVQTEGDRARVKLYAQKGTYAETWELQRIDGKWRVRLPRAALERAR